MSNRERVEFAIKINKRLGKQFVDAFKPFIDEFNKAAKVLTKRWNETLLPAQRNYYKACGSPYGPGDDNMFRWIKHQDKIAAVENAIANENDIIRWGREFKKRHIKRDDISIGK